MRFCAISLSLLALSWASTVTAWADITVGGDFTPAEPFWSNHGDSGQDGTIGGTGVGSLVVTDDFLNLRNAVLGYGSGGFGTATISGASQWTMTGELLVGYQGGGSLGIEGGATVQSAIGEVWGWNAKSSATITGTGSLWRVTASAFRMGWGDLELLAGGRVESNGAVMGSSTGPSNIVISGAGSEWTLTDDIHVDGTISGGPITVTVSDGGHLNAGMNSINVSGGAATTFVLNVGSAEGSAATAPGTVSAYEVVSSDEMATVVFNHTGSNYQFNSILAVDTVHQIAGHTVLTEYGFHIADTVTISGGELDVNRGTIDGVVTIESGGTLAGQGYFTDVYVESDGTLAPGTGPEALSIGRLFLESDAHIVFELGQAGVVGGEFNSLLDVLQLEEDGILDLTFLPGATIGEYTLFEYNTLVSGGGFAFGDTPDGFAGYLTDTGNSYVLTVTAVPEPSAAALLLGALGFAALRRRRRE